MSVAARSSQDRLYILSIEDCPEDAELLGSYLNRSLVGPFELTVEETLGGGVQRLAHQEFNIVNTRVAR